VTINSACHGNMCFAVRFAKADEITGLICYLPFPPNLNRLLLRNAEKNMVFASMTP
jgi:hypothetical protein